jgi:hypothetical protein
MVGHLYPANALANGQWWLMANQCGGDGPNALLGRSRIIAPDGAVIAEAPRFDGDGDDSASARPHRWTSPPQSLLPSRTPDALALRRYTRESAMTRSLARSANAMMVPTGFTDGMVGNTEASTTRSPVTPRTRRRGSHTAI